MKIAIAIARNINFLLFKNEEVGIFNEYNLNRIDKKFYFDEPK